MSIPEVHLFLRITARTSGAVFLLAFVAPELLKIWDSGISRALHETRNGLLLLFAALHTVHLVFIVALARAVGPAFFAPRQVPGILLGGLVYLLIYSLAGMTLAKGREHPAIGLHHFRVIASYVIWAAFALAFTASVFTYPALLPLVLATYAALGVRIAAARRYLSRRTSAADRVWHESASTIAGWRANER
jgi:hypothetical protein